MSKSIFIAGTGLSVGKTYISALLIKKLMQGGLKAGYYKPVQIGAVNLDGRLVAGDPLRVSKECGLYEDPNSMSTTSTSRLCLLTWLPGSRVRPLR